MRVLDSEVVDAAWAAVEALVAVPVDTHPPGGHRRRVPDRVCLQAMLTRLVTGCCGVTAERLLNYQVSDTTLRARRDEWVAAGVFDASAAEALQAYDRVVGLDLTEVAVDGSQHKAPRGGAEPAQTPPTGGNSVGSGHCCATGPVSPSPGPPTARTVTTRACSVLPWTSPKSADCSKTSRPCTWTAARTPTQSGSGCLSGHRRGPLRPPNAPTRGCGTSDSSAPTPTGAPNTDSPNSPWPSPRPSAPSSPTGPTAGTAQTEQSAHALSRRW